MSKDRDEDLCPIEELVTFVINPVGYALSEAAKAYEKQQEQKELAKEIAKELQFVL